MSGHCLPSNTPPSENATQFHFDRQQSKAIFRNTIAMEEISSQLQDMCVDDLDGINNANSNNNSIESSDNSNEQQLSGNNTIDCYMDSSEDYNHHRNARLTSSDIASSLMTGDDDDDGAVRVTNRSNQEEVSNILVATNVDSRLFTDEHLKQQFESLFIAYDSNVTFRYLKSFRRVRLDFTSHEQAEAARLNYNSFNVDSLSKCYAVQMIKAQGLSSAHLLPPKPTRQFLISPPASPPVGWEPVTESSPCIDVQLLSAIANLVPGETHLIHEATESQPGIMVEVCDDLRMQADRFGEIAPIKQVTRITPTARPL